MKFRLLGVMITTAAGLAAASPAWSHHSFAMFERDKEVTLKGTVKEFQWINPHSWIVLTVTSEAGKSEDWAIEGASTLALSRSGWKKDSLKPGDRVVVVTKPLKNGDRGGSFVSVTLADGKVLGQRAAP